MGPQGIDKKTENISGDQGMIMHNEMLKVKCDQSVHSVHNLFDVFTMDGILVMLL
jgi:hypothetical protein